METSNAWTGLIQVWFDIQRKLQDPVSSYLAGMLSNLTLTQEHRSPHPSSGSLLAVIQFFFFRYF